MWQGANQSLAAPLSAAVVFGDLPLLAQDASQRDAEFVEDDQWHGHYYLGHRIGRSENRGQNKRLAKNNDITAVTPAAIGRLSPRSKIGLDVNLVGSFLSDQRDFRLLANHYH